MVRKDPINERGPTPPGGRPKKEPDVHKRPSTLLELRPEEEYAALWKHAEMAAMQHLNLLQVYLNMGLPNARVEDLKHLRDYIDEIIQQNEARSDE